VSGIKINVVDAPGGARIELTKGPDWDRGGYGTGYSATAPEIDRLIAELAKARDLCRAKNRPSNPFWKRP
jgi:hypothetical protein